VTSRPASYIPVPSPHAAAQAPLARLTPWVRDNQLAAMAGAFALGVFLGVLSRR